jgi:periplasmic copper chaperone A
MRIFIAALAAGLLLPAAAQAHVTLHPDTLPAGGDDTLLSVRVPNERDDASVTKLQLQLPEGFAEASVQPVAGWTANVHHVKLATPIKTDDGELTEGVDVITITATGKGIPVDGFQDFNLDILVPDKAGSTLTFKAVQTYSNGSVVRWIGPESSENPAPTVKIVAGGDDGAAAPAATTAPAATPAATAAPASSSDDGGSSNGLAIVALIIGALGLITGVAGLSAARRSRAAA